MENFLVAPFFATLLVTTSCSLFGVFVLWKKVSYFGDALSHAILLGLIIGALFETNQLITLVIFSILFATMISVLSQNSFFAKDAIVMIASYFCIAFAIILSDIFATGFDFTSYIFGDVLTVGSQEIVTLILITATIAIYIIFAFKKILLININQDLAKVSGIRIKLWDLSFLILLSLVIALSVRVVGVFLITALLVLPAAIARIFSTSPVQMLSLSFAIGISISAASFVLANNFGLTVSSTIIAMFCVFFLFANLLKNFKKPSTISLR